MTLERLVAGAGAVVCLWLVAVLAGMVAPRRRVTLDLHPPDAALPGGAEAPRRATRRRLRHALGHR